MEQNPYLETKNHSDIKKYSASIWNQNIHYRYHNGPPLILILSHAIQSTYSQLMNLKSILIICSHLRLGLTSNLFV